MFRRLLTAGVAGVVLAAGGVSVTRADQAVLVDFVGPVAPGATEEWSFTLVVAGHGIENVVYGELVFAPQVTLRYVAPSVDELGCANHPDETFFGHVGVLAAFRGDAGTVAHIDPLIGGQGWVGAAVPLEVTCPSAASTPPSAGEVNETLPPTDAAPAGMAVRDVGLLRPLLALSVAFGLVIAIIRQIRGLRLDATRR